MAAAAHYVEVNAPAQACYDWWRPLTRLPELFSDVQSVEALDGNGTRTRWKVDGPAGSTVEWQARIVEDAPPRKIAWTTVDDADPDVRNSGVVRFDDKGHGRTGVEISLEYEPPAGKLGEAVASLLADPQKKVERAAEQFRTVIEAR
ncbi:SRPBCC family protein [Amycolatopsis nivea]|uniref:SRPBCC family protein n=1 Tax=Amycolatopsis nivea TaxID=1644109 RepID=UPI0010701DB8|nr:SRPBCC family protein [Amycolatopsis nivea]